MNMKRLLGNLLLALPLLGFASYVSADLPSRTGLVALGCEPNVKTATLPSAHPNFRVSARKRYVFMNRDASGVISKFCMDEIGTDKSSATTCTRKVDSGSVIVSPEDDGKFGFYKVTVFRKDASVEMEPYSWQDRPKQRYACTPSQDANAILDYVIQSKLTQRSKNAF